MKNPVFRPVEFWKSVMMTLPDNAFFELVRSVAGKIKTPFNKQSLVSDLESFLSRRDIQKNVAAYIENQDALVIAAVAALGEPAGGELESFFSGEMSYAELSSVIVNLEERFILYRFRDDRPGSRGWRLALNPVLKTALAPAARNAAILLPSVPAPPGSQGAPVISAIDDRFFAALLSFASEAELVLKNEAKFRKRDIESAKSVFQGADLEAFFGGLLACGLFHIKNDRLFPDWGRFEDFAVLGKRRRLEYFASGIFCHSESGGVPLSLLETMSRGKVQKTAVFISRFLDSLDPSRLYPEKTLKRLLDLLSLDSGEKFDGGGLLAALCKTGLLSPDPPQTAFRLSLPAGGAEKGETPLIAADSDFSFMVYPEIGYADAISLAGALEIRQCGLAGGLAGGLAVRFELTKESALRAFDRGISADWIIALLSRLSAGRLSEALVFSVKEWEKRYGEVSLRRGVVLSLSEDRRYLAQTKTIEPLIREALAPGLFLLDEGAEDEAAEALSALGVDIVCKKKAAPPVGKNEIGFFSVAQNGAESGFYENCDLKTDLKNSAEAALAEEASGLLAEHPQGSAQELLQGFRAMLEKSPLGKGEKDELAARIERRLILCESQLRNADIRYEKMEARLLDYAGKVNIAKQAIAGQSLVEVIWQDGSRQERVFGIPKGLPKWEGGQVLTLASQEYLGEAEIRIPLGKVILLRRIKKSIFET